LGAFRADSGNPSAGRRAVELANRSVCFPVNILRMHESDRQAVTQVVSGDGNAFQSLVERHSKYVFHVAYRLTGSSQDAEDVVQETFLKAYRQLSRFEARADFRTWLHRITVNCAIDYIRAGLSR
jgi:RNA polymerase sigma-70 factor (ECF subfamily)